MNGSHMPETSFGTAEQWTNAKAYFAANPDSVKHTPISSYNFDSLYGEFKQLLDNPSYTSDNLKNLGLGDLSDVRTKINSEIGQQDKNKIITQLRQLSEKQQKPYPEYRKFVAIQKYYQQNVQPPTFYKIDNKIVIKPQDNKCPPIGQGAFGIVYRLFEEGKSTPSYVAKHQSASYLSPNETKPTERDVLEKINRLKYYEVIGDSAITIEPFFPGNSMKMLLPGCKQLSKEDYPNLEKTTGLTKDSIQKFQAFVDSCYLGDIPVENFKENFKKLVEKNFGGLDGSFKEICKSSGIDTDATTINNLDALLKVTSLDDKAILDIVIKITEKVAELHNAGFCHNDLNPGNVILQMIKDGQETIYTAELIDFGTCTDINDKEPDQVFVGTPQFTAPEVKGPYSKTSKFTAKTDTFFLAKVLMEYAGLKGDPWLKIFEQATEPEEDKRIDLNELLTILKSKRTRDQTAEAKTETTETTETKREQIKGKKSNIIIGGDSQIQPQQLQVNPTSNGTVDVSVAGQNKSKSAQGSSASDNSSDDPLITNLPPCVTFMHQSQLKTNKNGITSDSKKGKRHS